MIALARKFMAAFVALWVANLFVASACGEEPSALKPFTADSLAAIKQAHQRKPFILAFWSLHCAPCKEDVALLKVIHRKHPSLPIVLVATDGPGEHTAVRRFLAAEKLGRIEQWAFADEFKERIRYAVDKEWRGELPRTYLYDAAHQPSAHTGVLDAKAVERWLAR
jgi:hypothetical protein